MIDIQDLINPEAVQQRNKQVQQELKEELDRNCTPRATFTKGEIKAAYLNVRGIMEEFIAITADLDAETEEYYVRKAFQQYLSNTPPSKKFQ